MDTPESADMAERRALLTDREREIIAGEADVTDDYRYQTISRVRSRLQRLEGDIEALEAHGDLAEELREAVCEDTLPAGGHRVVCPECGHEGKEAAVREHARKAHGLEKEELDDHYGHEHPLSSEHYG